MKTARKAEDLQVLSSVEEIVEDIRNGRMVILVDDEDRENEGDLVVAAQFATPDVINFMATHGRGLICLALEQQQVQRLGLPPMAQMNNAPLATAFTVSIEARVGVSTGISAPDRARTVQVAIDPKSSSADIVSPGHIFPLQAQRGGTLERTGHTEAAIDLARLAGLNPSGVICEIMKENGDMARLPDLVAFAQRHGLKIGTIADMVAYRLRTESQVDCLETKTVTLPDCGEWQLHVYRDRLHNKEILALVKGSFSASTAVPVRMHSLHPIDDIFGANNDRLRATLKAIDKHGVGVVVLMPGMSATSAEADSRVTLRRYGIGAQLLRSLGVTRMILLTETAKHIAGLQGFGLDLVEQKSYDSL